MADRVGDRLEATIPLFDGATPITGKAFAIDQQTGPSGAISGTTVTEIGGGLYLIQTLPTTVAGHYTVMVHATSGANQDPYVATWDVDTGWDMTQPVTITNGITRKLLRRRVLAKFGDLTVLTATATGSTTTLKDTTRIVGEPSRFAGRQVLFTGGTAGNLGLIRYITASSRDTNTITFSQALPSATASGDEAEMTNAHGLGVTFDAVHDCINTAIAIAQSVALVPLLATAADPFDGETTRSIALPDTFVGVNRVQYQLAETGEWKNLRHAAASGQDGWSVDRTTREITVAGSIADRINGLPVRVYGFAVPSPLTTDDDLTQVDLDWLLNETCSLLALDVVSPRAASSDWASRGLLWKQQADERYTRLTPNLGPSFVRLR